MSPPSTGAKEPAGAQSSAPRPALDDIMIAMDVVDTLRHDRRIAERELDSDARRAALIDRLREIYEGQGIEVSDAVLAQGVRALEEDRFSYTAPDPTAWRTRLAHLYVTRWQWGKYVLGGLGAIVALAVINYAFITLPAQREAAAEARTLEALPKVLSDLSASVAAEAQVTGVAEDAEAIAMRGQNAIRLKDVAAARAARAELERLLARLRSDYEIRVVNRPGTLSGVWRIPEKNPETYNFYLIVEAIDPEGNVVERAVTNEETGRRETVRLWGQRVERDVLVDIEADKNDDGIVQAAIVARKTRGTLEPSWRIPVRDGAITRW